MIISELPTNYLTCCMVGRIGNQMFQIAHAVSQSLTHNIPFVAPLLDTSVGDYLDNIFRDINFYNFKTDNLHNANRKETTFSYSQDLIPCKESTTIFHGFFQSEKFFIKNKEYIKKIFSPTLQFIKECHAFYPETADVNNNITVINVRRGDYLTQPENHPVITREYIYEAIKLIDNLDKIYIISDDLPWCKDNLQIKNCVFVEYVTWKAMWLMSLCRNFIISNSTFSWWGAYLGEKENSTVIAPSVWFGPGVHGRGHYETDIYKDNWLQVPTEYCNGEIKLKT